MLNQFHLIQFEKWAQRQNEHFPQLFHQIFTNSGAIFRSKILKNDSFSHYAKSIAFDSIRKNNSTSKWTFFRTILPVFP